MSDFAQHIGKLVHVEWREPQYDWHMFSLECSACGSVQQDMPLSVRQWICPDCGACHDRDLNAARNLATYAVSSTVSACGEEGSGCGRTTAAKPASVKQEASSRLSQK